MICSRCGRERRDKFIVMRKNKWTGKVKPRCRARSVCSSIARRKREREANAG